MKEIKFYINNLKELKLLFILLKNTGKKYKLLYNDIIPINFSKKCIKNTKIICLKYIYKYLKFIIHQSKIIIYINENNLIMLNYQKKTDNYIIGENYKILNINDEILKLKLDNIQQIF